MADKEIELVVKIDEEYYNDLKSLPLLPFSTYPEEIIYKGVPLVEKNQRRNKKLVEKISNIAKTYPKTYSDKVYDAATIDEGIEEVERTGIRRGLEMAISIMKKENEK